MAGGRRVAVIGGGWAGLAAAIEAVRRGAQVTLFEMAPQLGGRAREVLADGVALDNGQHICIGAYSETLRLLRDIGVAESDAFLRTPLRLVDPEGRGLALGAGPPMLAFARAVLRHPHWNWFDKISLMATTTRWLISGFKCRPEQTVAELTAELRPIVRAELVEPLCVAALNTPMETASGEVFLRVLRDALFSAPGSSDLLIPRVGLGAVLPAPAARWLRAAGVDLRLRHRVRAMSAIDGGWQVDDEHFAAVVLAASAQESARLAASTAPIWADVAGSMPYAPIVTVYLRSPGTVLPWPMLALKAAPRRPAQFVFDRGQLGAPPGLLAFVVSGAEAWVAAGTEATIAATCRQAREALGPWLHEPLTVTQVVTERRATFRCIPALRRPAMRIADNLAAAGDYVDGPYPSTLEGAIRSGLAAARAAVAS